VRVFATFTEDLERLTDWLEQCGVTTVALESTGVLDSTVRDPCRNCNHWHSCQSVRRPGTFFMWRAFTKQGRMPRCSLSP
jgi:hypothetical protein